MSGLFARRGTRIESRLSVDDKALLVQIPDLLAEVGEDDPAHRVLNRTGYPKNEAAEAEYRDLIGSQLDIDRRNDLRSLLRFTEPEATVEEDEARAALRAINAARLTLAARADIIDHPDGWETRISEDPALAAVAWLGYIQSELLVVLMD